MAANPWEVANCGARHYALRPSIVQSAVNLDHDLVGLFADCGYAGAAAAFLPLELSHVDLRRLSVRPGV
jgi:hypothetical protein